jgi:GTP1/Obg family GTP-binding protein
MIEKVATLALKYVTDAIIYIFDLTEPYSLDDQKKLYEEMKKLRKPVLLYLSKTDILEHKKVVEFKKEFKEALTTPEALKKEIKNLKL